MGRESYKNHPKKTEKKNKKKKKKQTPLALRGGFGKFDGRGGGGRSEPGVERVRLSERRSAGPAAGNHGSASEVGADLCRESK